MKCCTAPGQIKRGFLPDKKGLENTSPLVYNQGRKDIGRKFRLPSV